MAQRRPRIARIAPPGDDQPDMLVPDIQDIPLKDFGDLMTAPLLFNGDYRGRAKRVTKLEYSGNSGTVTVTSDEKGIATIRDYDLILCAISYIVDEINQGVDPKTIGRRFQMNAFTFIKFARRNESKQQYDEIENMLHRLTSTTITTKLKRKSSTKINGNGRHWIEKYQYERDTKTGKISELDFTIADWIHEAVLSRSKVLTLDRDYFLLHPHARWIYRVMRKSAGNNIYGWRYSIDELYRLSGSTISKRKWKYYFKGILKDNPPILDFETAIVKDPNTGKEYLHYIHIEQFGKLQSHFNHENGISYGDIPVNPSKLELVRPWLSDENFTHLKEAKEKVSNPKLVC